MKVKLRSITFCPRSDPIVCRAKTSALFLMISDRIIIQIRTNFLFEPGYVLPQVRYLAVFENFAERFSITSRDARQV